MRNGGIGKGWHPDEIKDELCDFAIMLLKDKLEEVFGVIKERHLERLSN